MPSVDDIAEDYVERAAALDPALATFCGSVGGTSTAALVPGSTARLPGLRIGAV